MIARSLTAALTVALTACSQQPKTADGRLETIDAMYKEYKADFPEVRDITVSELLELDEDSYVVVDVREVEEQRVSMIPGAVTSETFEANPEKFQDKTVVAHCTIGYRSGLYAEKLAEKGFDARNLKGSVLAWAHAGKPFVDSEGKETKRVHVYGPKWNLLPPDYEGVWE